MLPIPGTMLTLQGENQPLRCQKLFIQRDDKTVMDSHAASPMKLLQC